MTKVRQQTRMSKVRTAADVVEHTAALREMTLGKFVLDTLLSLKQPIQGRVEFIHIRIPHAQLLGQGGRLPQPGGSQLRTGMQDPLDDHGHHQIALSARATGNQRFQSQPTEHGKHRMHMPVRQGTDDAKGLVCGDERFPFEDSAEQFNLLQRQGRKVGQGAVLHLAVFAIAFAQQVGRWRVAIGDFSDVHADIVSIISHKSRAFMDKYMTTFCISKQTEVP